MTDKDPALHIKPQDGKTVANLQKAQMSEAFFKALAAGDVNTVKAMVAEGFDLKTFDSKKGTVLHAVAETKHVEIFDFLITTSARTFLNAEIEDLYFERPLHRAVKAGQLKMVEALLHAGVDLYAKNYQGATALHEAIKLKDHHLSLKMIDLLVKNGLHPEKLRSHMGEPILFDVLRQDHPRLMDYFLERFAFDLEEACQHRKRKLLHMAVLMNSQRMVLCLLNHGADINGRDQHGSTPLHLAVHHHIVHMAGLLVKHGADAQLKNMRQVTAYELAFIGGNSNMRAVFNQATKKKKEKPMKKARTDYSQKRYQRHKRKKP